MTAQSVSVGTLTDAELAVLSRPRTRVGPRPAMPVWAGLDGDQRAASARERAGVAGRPAAARPRLPVPLRPAA